MADLDVRGGRAVDGTACDVRIRGGRIADAATAATVLDATGLWVLPGLIDAQVNGACGVDLTLEPEGLWDVAAQLPRFGVTAFVPTIITAAAESRQRALAALAAGPPAGWRGAVPLGLHFEGPMISPARKGAHPERWLAAPSSELIEGWSRVAGVCMVTLAPELAGALDVVVELTARGVVVAVGHTEADAAQVRAAVDAGARMVTHLGNAMPPLAGRRPGPVGAALADDRLTAGVIADGHHLDPATLGAYWRALGSRCVAVTDCTAALGLPDGPTRLGDQQVHLRDGAVRLDDGTLAGSATSLPHCVAGVVAATGCELADAVRAATGAPATLLGDRERGAIATGRRGDLTLLDHDLRLVATVVGGRVLYEAPERETR